MPNTVLICLIWSLVVHANLEHRNNAARITVNTEAVFKRYNIRKTDVMWKLVKDPVSSKIYAGGPNGLYELEQNGLIREVKPKISLLTEGKDGTMFICEMKEKENHNECCFLNSKSDQGCFTITHPVQINEPSLLVDRTLFFTMSGQNNGAPNSGLYKQSKDSYTWPHSRIAKTFVKIITNSRTSLDGHLYSFQTGKNANPDPETPLMISQVSQYCMGDKGGTKSLLQYRWTSTLTARLFCGKKAERLTYTELLDVAELETSNGTMIYTLFKNAYGIRAICVYKMSEITRIFASSNFSHPKDPIPTLTPGECVPVGQPLSIPFLKFMGQCPEMVEWIEPERDPIVFSRHLYTHLQVDRVNSQNVLLLTLESGKIHKVLEKEDGHFIIAEYHPFKTKNHIHSMVLDRSNKKLYVSNSSQVVQIDLQSCSQYGDTCKSCVMAQDPYCSWRGYQCLNATGDSAEVIRSGEPTVCESQAKHLFSSRSMSPPLIIPQDSKYYLTCSTLSKYASYSWIHDGSNRIECVSTEEECFLLIESMKKKDDGLYECIATEEGQQWTISSYHLKANDASLLRVAPPVLAWLLILISVTF